MRISLIHLRKIIREAIEDKEEDEFLRLIGSDYDYANMSIDEAIKIVQDFMITANTSQYIDLVALLDVFTRHSSQLTFRRGGKESTIVARKLINSNNSGPKKKEALMDYIEMAVSRALKNDPVFDFFQLFDLIREMGNAVGKPYNYNALIDALVNLKIDPPRFGARWEKSSVYYGVINAAPERESELFKNILRAEHWRNDVLTLEIVLPILLEQPKRVGFTNDDAYNELHKITQAIKEGSVKLPGEIIKRKFFWYPTDKLPLTPKLLDDLSHHSSIMVRFEVAKRRNLLPRTIRRLQNDPVERVRERIQKTVEIINRQKKKGSAK